MDATLQQLLDDIQADINSKQSPTANPLLVRAADEADILNRIVNYLDSLNNPGSSNIEPYQDDALYSSTTPDYVTFGGETYQYINATPTSGNEPPNPTYWASVSGGAFTHQQNTDTGTNQGSFFAGDPSSQEQEGGNVIGWRTYSGGPIIAIRGYYDASVAPEVRKLQLTTNYTGPGSAWVDIDPAALLAAIAANTAALTARDTIKVLTDASTVAWDMNEGHSATVTIAGNRALSISNPARFGVIKVKQDATGSRTLSLPANSKLMYSWSGVPILSSNSNAEDILSFFYDGTNFYWNIGSRYI